MDTELTDSQLSRRRVVCAANRHRISGEIVLGARHYDSCMRYHMTKHEGFPWWGNCDQGFIDQWGNFLTRSEALEIAERQGQIRSKHGNPNELYSEDLY